MESFWIELVELIVEKCSKKRCSQNIGRTYKKTRIPKYNFRQYKVIRPIRPQTSDVKLRIKVEQLTSWTSYVCLLHVDFTFVLFWDDVGSMKTYEPYRIWL